MVAGCVGWWERSRRQGGVELGEAGGRGGLGEGFLNAGRQCRARLEEADADRKTRDGVNARAHTLRRGFGPRDEFRPARAHTHTHKTRDGARRARDFTACFCLCVARPQPHLPCNSLHACAKAVD